MPSGYFKPFTKEQEQQIKDEFLLKPVKALATELGCGYGRIMRFLKINNLEIPKELIQQRISKFQYKKGSTPFNKGKKISDFMSAEGIMQSKKTRFQKGNEPANTHPDGDGAIVLRRDTSGKLYKYIRIKKSVWKLYHRVIWEKNHGKIPPNHVVAFKDNNTQNTRIENLELISRSENMYRNSKKNYPKEIIPSLVLNKQLENKLNKIKELNNDVFAEIEQLQDKNLTVDEIQEKAKIISVLTSPEIKSAKKCPICNETKTLDNFYRYFNKPTNKFMHTTYCDPCAKIKRSIAAKKRYQKNRLEVLIKVKKYRKENADKIREYEARNKDKIKKTKSEYRKKYVKNLETPYVAALIAQRKKCSIKEVYQSPELIEAYRNNIKFKRLTRNYGKK